MRPLSCCYNVLIPEVLNAVPQTASCAMPYDLSLDF